MPSSSAPTGQSWEHASCNPSSHTVAVHVDKPAGGQSEAVAHVQVSENNTETVIVEEDGCLELPGSYDGAGSPKKREPPLYFALHRVLTIRCASRSLY